MPTKVGPNTFGEENLVFAFDTGDTANSYRGEPTTNNIVDQRYSFEVNRSLNDTTASWSESEQVWYFTLPSGSQAYYRGLRVVNSITSPYAVFEPTGSSIAFSYKIQALSDGLWNFIDYNNRAATGSQSYGNDNRSSTNGPSTIALEKGRIYERRGSYVTQANDPLLTGSLYHCYNVICLGPPNAGNTTVDNGGAVSEAKTVKIWDIQHELNDHATQFTEGTRSVSGSLLDLTGNTTLNLSNVSFDSNAQMTFDGTDDGINISSPTLPSSGGSIEVVVSREGTTPNSFIYAHVAANTNRYYLRQPSADTFDAVRGNPLSYASFGTLDLGVNYHLVMTWDETTIYAYKNGALQNTASYTNPGTDAVGGQIGDGPGENGNIRLPLMKLYNRALTASEIKSNFNAIKGRFNI